MEAEIDDGVADLRREPVVRVDVDDLDAGQTLLELLAIAIRELPVAALEGEMGDDLHGKRSAQRAAGERSSWS